jgi:hypothetical protein
VERDRTIRLRLFASRFEGLENKTASAWRKFVQAREMEDERVAITALDDLLGQVADDSLASPPLRALAKLFRQAKKGGLGVLPYPWSNKAN